jgi:hypothetical protein
VRRELASEYLADGGDELGLGGVLEHIARSADAQRLEQVVGVLVNGDDDHRHRRELDLELARSGEAVERGHAQIHQHQVGAQRAAQAERLGTVPSLADH